MVNSKVILSVFIVVAIVSGLFGGYLTIIYNISYGESKLLSETGTDITYEKLVPVEANHFYLIEVELRGKASTFSTSMTCTVEISSSNTLIETLTLSDYVNDPEEKSMYDKKQTMLEINSSTYLEILIINNGLHHWTLTIYKDPPLEMEDISNVGGLAISFSVVILIIGFVNYNKTKKKIEE